MKLDYTVLLVALAFFLIMLPVVQHLMYGIRERRREIVYYFDDDAIRQYFARYFPAENRATGWNANEEFRRFYNQRFGFRVYIPALTIFTLTLLIAVSISVGAALGEIFGVQMPMRLDKPLIAAALAGAYLWVFIELLSRFRKRDIVPATLYGATFRFGIAVPAAYAFASLFAENAQAAIAFMLGAFPTTTLMLVMRRLVAQKIGLGSEASTEKHELEQLQGINTDLAERFSEIGVSTFLQLAFEDPIQLTMRMNLPFREIIDVMSQALAALYTDDNFEVYRHYLVRSSIDCGIIYEQLDGEDPELQRLALAQIEAIATDLSVTSDIVKKIMFEVYNDSANRFFMSLPW